MAAPTSGQLLSTAELKWQFDLSANTPKFTFEDETDWATAFATTANSDYYWSFKLTVNNEATASYDNLISSATLADWDGTSGQADIERANGATRADSISTPITLPLNSDGTLVEGTYKLDYTLFYSDVTLGNGDEFFEAGEVTMDIQYDAVTGALSVTVDLNPNAPSFEAVDSTNYIQNSKTPTATSFPNSFRLKINAPSDAGKAASETTATSLTLGANQFYTGEQVTKLEAKVTYDYSSDILASATNNFGTGNLTVNLIDLIEDTERTTVQDPTGLCTIHCCIEEFEDRMYAAKIAGNVIGYQQMKEKAGLISMYVNLMRTAYNCGVVSTDNLNYYISQIKDLTDCDSCTSCGGGTPTVISALSSASVSLGNVIQYTTDATTPAATYTDIDLKGKVYTSTQQDFLVFVDKVKDNVTFNSTTGTITYSTTPSTSVLIEIVILK
jgi:hypothetical protein